MRHAHAGDPTEWDGPDAARPLSSKGRRQAERIAAFLVRAGIKVDGLVSSPKIRALETAEPIGVALGLEVLIDKRLSNGCDLGCLDAVVRDARARAPMVVGHDPDFSMLLSELLGSGPQVMRKGALATIDVRRPLIPGSGLLRWLVPPELLVERET